MEDVQSGKILLPHTHISVDDCSGQDRFEKWRENMSGLYDVEAEKSVRDDNFYAYVDACVMDSIMLVETQTRQMDWYRTPLNIANDGMDHLIVQIFLDGDAAFMEGQRSECLACWGNSGQIPVGNSPYHFIGLQEFCHRCEAGSR